MAEENKDSMDEKDKANKSGGIKLGVIVILLLAAGGGGGWFLTRSKAAAKPKEEPKVRYVMHLESFVLNVDENKYLRVGIDLGLEHSPAAKESKEREKEKEGGGDGAVPTSVVRDTILTVLMRVKSDQLSTPEGKSQLKQELLRALEERVPELGVREIYYTEFLLQS